MATDADRIRSRALGCHLRAVGEGTALRLRIASGARGDTLYRTDAERAEAEHARAEAESARAERAEAELGRLRAQLARRPRKR